MLLLPGGAYDCNGQSSCELPAPRVCHMRGSMCAVPMQEPVRSVGTQNPPGKSNITTELLS